jgi:hypothetical protein
MHAPVVIVKPGGTGSPRSVAMTTRFVALPPRSRISSSRVPGGGASKSKI